MSRAPASASSASATPFSASTKAAAASCGSKRASRWCSKRSVSQRLEPLLPSDGGAGPPLGTEGKIEVFQGRHGLGGVDLRPKLLGQESALLQGLEDGPPALVEFLELGQAVPDRGDGDLVERSGGLLAVPRDERDGPAGGQKFGRGGDLRGTQAQFAGDSVYVKRFHFWPCLLC